MENTNSRIEDAAMKRPFLELARFLSDLDTELPGGIDASEILRAADAVIEAA